jgi:hypothetical protein
MAVVYGYERGRIEARTAMPGQAAKKAGIAGGSGEAFEEVLGKIVKSGKRKSSSTSMFSDDVALAAARWVNQLHASETPQLSRPSLEAWLAADPAHRQAFRAMKLTLCFLNASSPTASTEDLRALEVALLGAPLAPKAAVAEGCPGPGTNHSLPPSDSAHATPVPQRIYQRR